MSVYTIKDLNLSLLDEKKQQLLNSVLIKHNVLFSQVTSGGRLKVSPLTAGQFRALQREISRLFPAPDAITVTYVKSCPGLQQCRYAMKDALSLGADIEKLSFSEPFPHKVKVAVAGCRMCCTEPYLRDVGLIGEKKGWKVIFGGNGGGRPRIGDVLQSGLDSSQALELVRASLNIYLQYGRKKQRTARFIEAFGLAKFKKIISK